MSNDFIGYSNYTKNLITNLDNRISTLENGSSNLSGVLSLGNTAGNTGIDMNNQYITNVSSIGNDAATIAIDETGDGDINVNMNGSGSIKLNSLYSGGYQNPLLQIKSNYDIGTGVYVDIYTNSGTISAGDDIGSISFSGNGNSNNKLEYARITGEIDNKESDGSILIRVRKNNTITTGIQIDGDSIRIPFGVRDNSLSMGNYGEALCSTGSGGINWRNLVPVGTIQMFSGITLPSGWLWCNGASYAIETYLALFNVIGNSFGGTQPNFNVPNMEGYLPVGNFTQTPGTSQQQGTLDAYAIATWQDVHTHNVDVAVFTGGAPTNNVTVASGSGATVASSTHSHNINPPNTATTSTTIDLSGIKRMRLRYIIKF